MFFKRVGGWCKPINVICELAFELWMGISTVYRISALRKMSDILNSKISLGWYHGNVNNLSSLAV